MANEALLKFKAEIEELTDYQYDEAMFTNWLRLAEATIGNDLRIEDQVTFATATATQGRISLPSNWLENEFVRVVGGQVLTYVPREMLYDHDYCDDRHRYSLAGLYLLLGPPIDAVAGLTIEVTYFARPQPLETNETWLSTKYRALLTAAVLVYCYGHLSESEASASAANSVASGVATLNGGYLKKKSGMGSISRPKRIRGFN